MASITHETDSSLWHLSFPRWHEAETCPPTPRPRHCALTQLLMHRIHDMINGCLTPTTLWHNLLHRQE